LPGFFVGVAALRAATPTKNPGKERSEEQLAAEKACAQRLWQTLKSETVRLLHLQEPLIPGMLITNGTTVQSRVLVDRT